MAVFRAAGRKAAVLLTPRYLHLRYSETSNHVWDVSLSEVNASLFPGGNTPVRRRGRLSVTS